MSVICPIDLQPCDRCNEGCGELRRVYPAIGVRIKPEWIVTNVTLDKPTQACFNGVMTNEQTLPVRERRLSIGFTDLRAAIRHDYNIARKEGFAGVALRAELLLADLDRIDDEFTRLQQVGYKVEIVITPVTKDPSR